MKVSELKEILANQPDDREVEIVFLSSEYKDLGDPVEVGVISDFEEVVDDGITRLVLVCESIDGD